MPEIDHVRGITGHTELAGPPVYPPSSTVTLPPWDQFKHGVLPHGDEDDTSRRYFVETHSPYNADVVVREADPQEDNGGTIDDEGGE